MHKPMLVLVLALGLTACGSDNPRIEVGSASQATKLAKPAEPAAARPTDEPKLDAPALPELAGKSVVASKFDLAVKVAGFEFCSGVARFLVNVPGTPGDGTAAKAPLDIKCVSLSCALVGEIRIDSLLGGLSGGTAKKLEKPSGNAMALESDEHFLRVASAGSIVYTPPMILLPNFGGAAPEYLKKMNESQAMSLHDATSGASASGTQKVKTLQFDKPWKGHKVPAVKLEKVFHFRLENSGFDGVDKVSAMLFEVLEAHINLDPIAVGHLYVRLAAADLMGMMTKKEGGAPAYDPECGPPPPPPAPSSGLMAALGPMLGIGGGGGGGGGGGSIVGTLIGLVVNKITKLVKVELNATLTEQQGLKEAMTKKTAFDELRDSSSVEPHDEDKSE